MAKICGQCGAQFPDTANICGNCGAPLAAPAQPAQPQYQAPAAPYQYAPAAPKKPIVETVSDLVIKLLGVALIVFICLGAVGFLYEFIMAIVNASDAYSNGFRIFVTYFAGAIATAAKYAFYAVVTAIGAKLLKK